MQRFFIKISPGKKIQTIQRPAQKANTIKDISRLEPSKIADTSPISEQTQKIANERMDSVQKVPRGPLMAEAANIYELLCAFDSGRN
jgi:hypothetical protein